MQTSLYEITFKDGRVFKVFCANRKHNEDMLHLILENKEDSKMKSVEVLTEGIHTMLEFKKIIK